MADMNDMRVRQHYILGQLEEDKLITIFVDGVPIPAREGEPIAAALLAAGKVVKRYTKRFSEPRGVFCGIGQCNDCIMTVDGRPNMRTCITPVHDGMIVETPGRSKDAD